jgi:hypothetical protein
MHRGLAQQGSNGFVLLIVTLLLRCRHLQHGGPDLDGGAGPAMHHFHQLILGCLLPLETIAFSSGLKNLAHRGSCWLEYNVVATNVALQCLTS